MESVQCIVLATSRPESIGASEEVFLVDGLENRRDRLLDDFVRPLRAISLRNVGSSGWMRPVTASILSCSSFSFFSMPCPLMDYPSPQAPHRGQTHPAPYRKMAQGRHVEDGRRTRGVCGAPQGAVISPTWRTFTCTMCSIYGSITGASLRRRVT
jgi:hypothetical protein